MPLKSNSTAAPLRVLVTAGSRHGATKEIAERIGNTLSQRGLSVSVREPHSVKDLNDVDVVVLGSAVYAGRWVREAKDVADLIAASESKPQTWLFSSGPIGDPPKPDDQPVDVDDIAETTNARDHRVFSGKIDRSRLSFGEKAMVIAVRAAEGDFRDWDEIDAWAGNIADELTPTSIGSSQT